MVNARISPGRGESDLIKLDGSFIKLVTGVNSNLEYTSLVENQNDTCSLSVLDWSNIRSLVDK